jgi:hypothetical protein
MSILAEMLDFKSHLSRNGIILIQLKKLMGRRYRVQEKKQYTSTENIFLNKPELLRLIPIELKDKTLGCWCKPNKCHGDVLVELADK